MSDGFIEDAYFVYGKESMFELKCFDTSEDSTGNAVVNLVGDIAMGTGWDQRVGDEIFIHRIDVRGYQKILPPLYCQSSGKVMNLLFVDTQCVGGAVPGTSDLFADYVTSNGANLESPVFARLDLSGRYIVVARDDGMLKNLPDGVGLITEAAHVETISATAANVNPMNFDPFLTGVTAIPPPAPVITTNTATLQSTQCFPDKVDVAEHDSTVYVDNIGGRHYITMSIMFSPPLKIRYDENLATPNALGPVPFLGLYGDVASTSYVLTGMFSNHVNISTYFTDDPIPYQKIARRMTNNFHDGARKRRVSLLDESIPKWPRLLHDEEPVANGGRKRSYEVDSRKRYRESSKR